MSLLRAFKEKGNQSSSEVLSFQEFLDLAKGDPSVYASPHARILKAIGEPTLIETKNDDRLSKLFSNRTLKVYPAFAEFFGMEEAIEGIVSFFRRAALGLEESKQILYLLGPVGGGKSSLAQRLRELAQKTPVYVIDGSPVFDSPLSVFNPVADFKELLEEYNINPHQAVRTIPSPWLLEKLKEVNNDLTKLSVRKIYPSYLRQEAMSRVEPADENNQDVSAMVGKLDIRMVERFSQNDPRAYSFSGGLCRGNNGMVEMVEMFKAPIKMLNPLLTAMQERIYQGTEAIGSIPFDGVIMAHSNESEWQTFRNNKTNEAFIDRICIVKVPYCLRVAEEMKIYEKLVKSSKASEANIAPGTLQMLAQLCVMSRLIEPTNSTLFSKMRVYNGENIKSEDPKAKPLQEYRDAAGVDEGMKGLSTRFAYKVLSKTIDYTDELAADPIHLMYILKTVIPNEQFPKEMEEQLIELIDGVLQERYLEFLEKEIKTAYLDSFGELCQNVFETYFYYADAWVQEKEFRDDTGASFDRAELGRELDKIEKPAGIANPKDFRDEITNFAIRYKSNHGGQLPRWDEFQKMRTVIEKKVMGTMEELLPVISYAPKRTAEDQQKHKEFIARMEAAGYTAKQTRYLCEWFMRVRKSG